ncbi:hypothetical protein B0T20DRAFT_392440 [Sordaria brevicollis]|uniref:Uncharacterized protein n=1 Tax=Sordaria brevicollis TaxID=83679 RepID=A0AAE0PGC0_SORBR|nr:hypothetical protein B0T20DRAFT_392440 [Sordaria brevicollis]
MSGYYSLITNRYTISVFIIPFSRLVIIEFTFDVVVIRVRDLCGIARGVKPSLVDYTGSDTARGEKRHCPPSIHIEVSVKHAFENPAARLLLLFEEKVEKLQKPTPLEDTQPLPTHLSDSLPYWMLVSNFRFQGNCQSNNDKCFPPVACNIEPKEYRNNGKNVSWSYQDHHAKMAGGSSYRGNWGWNQELFPDAIWNNFQRPVRDLPTYLKQLEAEIAALIAPRDDAAAEVDNGAVIHDHQRNPVSGYPRTINPSLLTAAPDNGTNLHDNYPIPKDDAASADDGSNEALDNNHQAQTPGAGDGFVAYAPVNTPSVVAHNTRNGNSNMTNLAYSHSPFTAGASASAPRSHQAMAPQELPKKSHVNDQVPLNLSSEIQDHPSVMDELMADIPDGEPSHGVSTIASHNAIEAVGVDSSGHSEPYAHSGTESNSPVGEGHDQNIDNQNSSTFAPVSAPTGEHDPKIGDNYPTHNAALDPDVGVSVEIPNGHHAAHDANQEMHNDDLTAAFDEICAKLDAFHIGGRRVHHAEWDRKPLAFFRWPIVPVDQCSKKTKFLGFELHCMSRVWQPGATKCFWHINNKMRPRIIEIVQWRQARGIWSCTGCYTAAVPTQGLCDDCRHKGAVMRERRRRRLEEEREAAAAAAVAQAIADHEAQMQGVDGHPLLQAQDFQYDNIPVDPAQQLAHYGYLGNPQQNQMPAPGSLDGEAPVFQGGYAFH